MKVRELVNILEELPQDKEVMVGYLDIFLWISDPINDKTIIKKK